MNICGENPHLRQAAKRCDEIPSPHGISMIQTREYV
jgi:hypothetical protein